MPNNDAEDPLLQQCVDSSNEDPLLQQCVDSSNDRNKRNATKSTQQKGAGDALMKNLLPQDRNDNLGTFQPPDYISQKKLDFNHVILFLVAYIGIGALCFFLVRNQIKGKKTNGILDAIYFCVVTMTTVGYGDLVPDSNLAKFLACILVFAGMALVGFILSKAADYILEKQEILLVKAIHMQQKFDQADILKEVEDYRIGYKFVTALSLLLFLMILGTIFLRQIENLNLMDSFYCVCATITTLGYGDKSFSTKGGRIFASLWILISTICLAQTLYYLAELYTERRRKSLIKWVITRKLTMADLEAADLDHDKVVSAAEFIVYKLKEMGKISDDDIAMVMERFKKLDVDQSGTLTETDLLLSKSS